jgi:hypothetical protein
LPIATQSSSPSSYKAALVVTRINVPNALLGNASVTGVTERNEILTAPLIIKAPPVKSHNRAERSMSESRIQICIQTNLFQYAERRGCLVGRSARSSEKLISIKRRKGSLPPLAIEHLLLNDRPFAGNHTESHTTNHSCIERSEKRTKLPKSKPIFRPRKLRLLNMNSSLNCKSKKPQLLGFSVASSDKSPRVYGSRSVIRRRGNKI